MKISDWLNDAIETIKVVGDNTKSKLRRMLSLRLITSCGDILVAHLAPTPFLRLPLRRKQQTAETLVRDGRLCEGGSEKHP